MPAAGMPANLPRADATFLRRACLTVPARAEARSGSATAALPVTDLVVTRTVAVPIWLQAPMNWVQGKKKAGIVFETGLENRLGAGYSSSIWLYMRLSWIS